MPFLLILTLISTVMSAFGQYMQGAATRKAANYNADIAEQQAAQARQKAAFDEGRQREKALRLQSSAQARASTSGLTMESFLPVFTESARQSEMDALAIRYGGEEKRWGLLAESELQKSKAKSAGPATALAVGGTLLEGGAKAYGYSKGIFTDDKTKVH